MQVLTFEEVKTQDIDILLVDDNPNDAELTFRALRKTELEFSIYWVKDGEEAMNFILNKDKYEGKSGAIRMILLDLKLPKLSGLEVLEGLRKNEETSFVPVVILSSSKEDSDLKTSYRLGVNSYVVKPVDFKQYMNTVGEVGHYWLSHNQYLF